MPGALPKIPLPKYLLKCRWARCAVVTEGSRVDEQQIGWFWDPLQAVAYAHGVSCFVAGMEYAHGGLSLQECVVPDVTVSMGSGRAKASVDIETIQWLGLRCRVVAKGGVAGCQAELRDKPNVPGSRVCTAKRLDAEGRAGLLVEDDALIGSATTLVILDGTGRLLAKQATIVGGDE